MGKDFLNIQQYLYSFPPAVIEVSSFSPCNTADKQGFFFSSVFHKFSTVVSTRFKILNQDCDISKSQIIRIKKNLFPPLKLLFRCLKMMHIYIFNRIVSKQLNQFKESNIIKIHQSKCDRYPSWEGVVFRVPSPGTFCMIKAAGKW